MPWTFKLPGKDPISAWTHVAGFLAGVVGLTLLVTRAEHSLAQTVSLAVYGGSLVLLFLASSAYHFFDLGPRGNRMLRRFDHAAIFVFIAGTYVPVITHLLDGPWRVASLAIVGGLAVLGVLFKLVFFHAPRWLNTTLYLCLGWIIAPLAPVMLPHFTSPQLTWMVAGGVFYTVGALVYGFKKPDPWPGVFGFHEIWHLFVLLGAGAHFGLAWSLLAVRPAPF